MHCNQGQDADPAELTELRADLRRLVARMEYIAERERVVQLLLAELHAVYRRRTAEGDVAQH